MFDDNIKTDLEWTSSLDIDYQPTNIRKTSIICTIGKLRVFFRNPQGWIEIVACASLIFFFCIMSIKLLSRPKDKQCRDDQQAPWRRHEHCSHGKEERPIYLRVSAPKETKRRKENARSDPKELTAPGWIMALWCHGVMVVNSKDTALLLSCLVYARLCPCVPVSTTCVNDVLEDER